MIVRTYIAHNFQPQSLKNDLLYIQLQYTVVHMYMCAGT